MMKRAIPISISTLIACASCGGGVPITLVLDDLTVDLSLDGALDAVAPQLLPPDSPALPERWPDEFPDICWDALINTDPDLTVDLTPDPNEDPAAAETFGPVNDGLVDRIEIDRLIVRIETNTLNIPLPTIEIQAADDRDADPDDRRAFRTLGAIGTPALAAPCAASADPVIAVGPGQLRDLDFIWARGGESYLNAQLADEKKEFTLRARSRLVIDTADFPDRPRGEIKLRLILVATFFVTPI